MKKSSLAAQVEKIFRHARQGSIQTRREYRKCMLRFVDWLDLNFKVQNLRNVSNKHLAAYVRHLLCKGSTASYVIKNLAAIRYYHDHLPAPRYELERNNAILGVPPRVPPGNRAWKHDEFVFLCNCADELGRPWIADILTLEHELGLRIHEAVRIYRIDAERALAYGALKIKGKGGKTRYVELTFVAEETLRRAIARVSRGERLFVRHNEKAHVVIKRVQDFIIENRPERDGERLTSHGLRYSYAQRRMAELESENVEKQEAELRVAEEMGHNRRRVTRGYIG